MIAIVLNGYWYFWTGWITVLLAGFGIVEWSALKSKHGVPLTEWMQWAFARRKHWHYVSLALWGVFIAWFTSHLWG